MPQKAPRPVWRDRAAGIVDDLERYQHTQNPIALQRRWRLAERLHGLGARVIFEFLDEIAREHDIGGDIDARLSRYTQLNADILAAVGGDRFPASPIREVVR
jgi:hypothetical protein